MPRISFPVLLALLAGVSTTASGEVTGLVALGSDYVWRGISQTDNQLALAGEIDYSHASGAYAGVWGGNVDFGPGDPSLELDLYAGYAGEFASGLSFDAGILRYEFPGASDLETQEVHLGLGYKDVAVTWHYTNDYFGSDASAWYLELDASFDLVQELTLSLHAGRSDGDHFDLADYSAYTDYRVGISRALAGMTLELAYSDTDLSAAECGSNTCDGRVVFTATKTF